MGARQAEETRQALRIFWAAKGKKSMREVADKTGINVSTLSRALKVFKQPAKVIAKYTKPHRVHGKVLGAKKYAAYLVAQALKTQPSGNCVFCDKPNAHAHHEDYSMPLDIVWLCRQHHTEVHFGKLFVSKEQIVTLKSPVAKRNVT